MPVARASDRNLVEGSVAQRLMQLTLPMIVGVIAVLSISVVDTYFVGQLGTNPQAALSFSFPVTLTVASLAIGLGAGAGSVVSRAIGADDRDRAKRLSTDSLVLASLVVLVVSAAGYTTTEPLFAALGASDAILPLVVSYMRIWFLSMPFLVVPMVANALIRASGDAVVPSTIMVGAAVANVILTPGFIFGWGPLPELGFEGAAVSTLVSRALTFVGALAVVVFRERMITTVRPALADLLASWRSIVEVAGPAAAGNMINPLGITAITAILAGFGDVTVAAFGVATRIESLCAIPMFALSASIGPVTGQNWGAGRRDRVLRAVKLGYGTCVAWSIAVAVALWLGAPLAAAGLASTDAVAQEAIVYLTYVPLTLGGYGIVIVGAGAFNGLGKSTLGLAFNLLRTGLLYVPLSWLAARWADSQAVYLAVAASNAAAGTTVAITSIRWLSRTDEAPASVPRAAPEPS